MEITTVIDLPESVAVTLTDETMDKLYTKYYGDSPFVAWDGSRLPQTRDVWGSNSCRIGWKIEGRSLMLFSTIDNLVKGASGQAVQNMNIRFGFDETAGLKNLRRTLMKKVLIKIGGRAASDEKPRLRPLPAEMKGL